MIRLRYIDGRFICKVPFKKRSIPKDAGFRFSPEERLFYTTSPSVAARLRAYADDATVQEFQRLLIAVTPWSKPLQTPPGLALKEYQPEPIKFVLSRNRSYLAADPGTGKTIMAAVAAATLRRYATIYVCPPFLTLNTEEEFKKWAPGLDTFVITAKTDLSKIRQTHGVFIIPDSILTRKLVLKLIETVAVTNVKTLLIVDEAHRFKWKKAKRTKALLGSNRGKYITKYGIHFLFDKTILMSGTPMPNRPLELYYMLSTLAPQTIDYMTEHDYGVEYCAGYRDAMGWKYDGASNVKELAKRVIHPHGPFMYRLRKDKLDLPPRIEELVIVDRDMSPKLADMSRNILRRYSPDDLMKGILAKQHLGDEDADLHIATYRRLMGLAKVPFTFDFVSDLLETTEESIILFAIHKECIAELAKKFYKYAPLIITGNVAMKKRHEIVKLFQKGKRRLLMANITAGGIGLTLTRSRRVIFHEYSWVPADNDQAIDRVHRIGQDKSVLAQFIAYRNSVDKAVLDSALRKKEAQRYI